MSLLETIFERNYIKLIGRIHEIREFSAGKSAEITVAVDGGPNHPDFLITTTSFEPNCYNSLKDGIQVKIEGYISPHKCQKGGKTWYTQTLVAASISCEESSPAQESIDDGALPFDG